MLICLMIGLAALSAHAEVIFPAASRVIDVTGITPDIAFPQNSQSIQK